MVSVICAILLGGALMEFIGDALPDRVSDWLAWAFAYAMLAALCVVLVAGIFLVAALIL